MSGDHASKSVLSAERRLEGGPGGTGVEPQSSWLLIVGLICYGIATFSAAISGLIAYVLVKIGDPIGSEFYRDRRPRLFFAGITVAVASAWLGYRIRRRSRPTPDTVHCRSRFLSLHLTTILAFLAVLAIFLSWFGAQLKWIRDRHEAWKWVENNRKVIWVLEPTPADRFPWILKMLGEEPHSVSIAIPATTAKDQERVRQLIYLFPDAMIEIAWTDEPNSAPK